MKLFLTLSKKSLAAALAIILVLLFSSAWVISLKYTLIDGETHEKRGLFIKSLGFEFDENNITAKNTVIPSHFGDVYSRYNDLQKKSGFDLSDYKGKSVVVYGYNLSHGNKVLHLIVCDGKIIGGDVCDTALGGEMLPLR